MDLRQVRAIVTDSQALSSLEPASVCGYLRRAGWTEAGERRTGSVWTLRLSDGVATVFVPNDSGFADYPIRMTEVLAALAVVEDRSQLAILADLVEAAPGSGASPAVGGAVVERLEALAEKATARPWQIRTDPHAKDETLVVTDVKWGGANYVKIAACDQPHGGADGQDDAELIAAAVNALPDLLAVARAAKRVADEHADAPESLARRIDALQDVVFPLFREERRS